MGWIDGRVQGVPGAKAASTRWQCFSKATGSTAGQSMPAPHTSFTSLSRHQLAQWNNKETHCGAQLLHMLVLSYFELLLTS